MGIPVEGGLGSDVPIGFQPLPVGVYDVEITNFEERQSGEDAKYPGTTYVAWEFTVTTEEFEGKKLWTNTSFHANGKPKLKEFLIGIGITEEEMAEEGFQVEPEEYLGKACKVQVTMTENKKTKEMQNKVSRVLPSDDLSSLAPSG